MSTQTPSPHLQPLLNPQESQKKEEEPALAFAIKTLRSELPDADARIRAGRCLYDTANSPNNCDYVKKYLAERYELRPTIDKDISEIVTAFSEHLFEILRLLQSASHQES